MPIKEFYQNGKRVSIGFDSLEEIYVFKHRPDLLTSETPIEHNVNDEQRRELAKDPEFIKWYKKMKGT